MAEDKKVIDVEVKEVNEDSKDKAEQKGEAEEKKENGFKRLWNKTKQSISDSMLETKIENTFNNNHKRADVYEYEKFLSNCVYGSFNEDETKFTCFGVKEVKPYSVFVDSESEKPYYVLSTEAGKVIVDLDGQKYERDATVITLTKDVEEVKVIKADKKYYIYKG